MATGCDASMTRMHIMSIFSFNHSITDNKNLPPPVTGRAAPPHTAMREQSRAVRYKWNPCASEFKGDSVKHTLSASRCREIIGLFDFP